MKKNHIMGVQGVLGAVAFLVFLMAMFNGETGLWIGVAIIAVAWNFAVAFWYGRRQLADGLLVAVVFTSPSLIVILLAILGVLADTGIGSLMFWVLATLVVGGAGVGGAVAGARSSK